MTEYELYIMYDNLEYSDFTLKEMSRILSYVIAQTLSRKKLSPQDIMLFPWDKQDGKHEKKVDTKEDIERAKQFGEYFRNLLTKEQESQK